VSKTADRFRRLAENKDTNNNSSNKSEVINKIIGADLETIQPLEPTNDTEETNINVKEFTETEETYNPVNSTTENNNLNKTVLRNSDTEQSDVIRSPRTSGRQRIPRPIEEFEKRLKRPKIEDTHSRATWLVKNDLLKRLERLAKNQERGFKTHLVNYALERILEELEEK